MDRTSFLRLVKEELGDELMERKGEAVFNSLSTIRKNDLYLAGFNPGGEDSHHRTIIEDTMREELEEPGCSKLDERWAEGRYGMGTKEVLRRLGYDYHDVFITNTFFSSSVTEFLMPKLTEEQKRRYGNLHRRLMSIVNPQFVICQGQHAFRQFRSWASEKERREDNGLRNGRFWKVVFPNVDLVRLVGIPHPSRGLGPTEEFYTTFESLRHKYRT